MRYSGGNSAALVGAGLSSAFLSEGEEGWLVRGGVGGGQTNNLKNEYRIRTTLATTSKVLWNNSSHDTRKHHVIKFCKRAKKNQSSRLTFLLAQWSLSENFGVQHSKSSYVNLVNNLSDSNYN